MNKGMLTVGIIILAIIALSLLAVLNNYATGSELDYYLLKETTDAAMIDAIDKSYLRTCGLYRLDKEKFVQSFLYRFANNVDASREYDIGFYDLNEVPPKVSVKIDSKTPISFNTSASKDKKEQANISLTYDAILEANYITDTHTEIGLNIDDDMCKDLNKIS